ncbi:MAG: gamma-glutamylcyclotransferase [Alphaproteobacteria bacterium]|jgi:cation transport protein ChaC
MTDPNSQPDLRHLTDQYELTEEELETTLSAVMATHAPEEDLWVFGYGSLMWQPEFPFEEQGLATVHGFHRSFCVYSHVWRGTRDEPGLVLGLDNGGSCRGIAYRVTASRAASTVEYLIRREMVTRVYIPRWVTARIGTRVVRAHTYTAAHNHVQYAGKLPDEKALQHILQGHGRGGANTEYLRNTVGHLDELGIVDRPLSRLHRMVEQKNSGAKS